MVFQKIVQYADKQRICINTQLKPNYAIKIERMGMQTDFRVLALRFLGPPLHLYLSLNRRGACTNIHCTGNSL